jgi:hypothetical protein
MTGDFGRGSCRHDLNEKVSYHERSVQDVIIEELQRQVVELTQHLAVQNIEMYCNIDRRDSEFNFENSYHNPVLVWEQRGRDKEFIDGKFQHEENVEDPS